MKRNICLTLLGLLVSLSSAYAGSGRGFGPGWMSILPSISAYTVTNITSHTLVVTFTPIKMDGTVVPNSYLGLWTDTLINTPQSEVELAPGKSCNIEIRSPGQPNGLPDRGMLTIDWKNKYDTENDYKGLVAHGVRWNGNPVNWTYSLPVNGGMPF